MRAFVFAAAVFAAGAAYAEPVAYVLDPAHTQVGFSIDRFGFNRVLGRFEDVTGEIVLDEANPANSSVRAVVQIASVDSGSDTRDGHLRGERWLNAAQNPTMEFRSTSVRRTGERTAEVVQQCQARAVVRRRHGGILSNALRHGSSTRRLTRPLGSWPVPGWMAARV